MEACSRISQSGAPWLHSFPRQPWATARLRGDPQEMEGKQKKSSDAKPLMECRFQPLEDQRSPWKDFAKAYLFLHKLCRCKDVDIIR